MYKIIISSMLVLSILGFNVFNAGKKAIENSQSKQEKIYAELGIEF